MIALRGYALPLQQAEENGKRLEFVAADSDLAFSPGAFLNFDSHDEAPLAPLTLFRDDYGIGFEASVDDATWEAMRCYVTTNFTQCSVEIADERGEWIRADGRDFWCVTSGTIAHVTVTDHAVYSGTGVWPGPEHVIGGLPRRLARLAARWEKGRAIWDRRQETRAWVQAELEKRRAARGGVPAAVARALRPRLQHYAGVRQAFFEAARLGQVQNGAMFGHAAFSKAAGWRGRP